MFYSRRRHTDFRELVRDLFATFKTRIWMQKIKSHEASGLQPQLHPIDMDYSPVYAMSSPGGEFQSSRHGGEGGGREGDGSRCTAGGGGRVDQSATHDIARREFSHSSSLGAGRRDEWGGAFVYQQQVPGARSQFGGSLPASPSSER
jgi:hypothetical protein